MMNSLHKNKRQSKFKKLDLQKAIRATSAVRHNNGTETYWMGHCPVHDDKDPSCKITGEPHDAKVHCFAGCPWQAVRDTLLARGCAAFDVDGLDEAPPAREYNKMAGLADGWEHVSPVPDDAPFPLAEYKKGYPPPTTHWEYLDSKRRLIFYAFRFDLGDGKKEVVPQTLWRIKKNGALEWKWKAHPAPRPLYNLHLLTAHPARPVVVVEGEKAADAAAKLLPNYVITTSPGGCNSADKADWTPLKGRDVIIWPDADDPGRKYAQDVARLAHAAGAASVKILPILDGKISGWDAADALAEGWTPERAAAYLATAQAWTPPADNAPTGAAETVQATEPPLPLVRVIEPAKPFPVDALGPILGPAAKVIQRATKAPMAMCGNSVLAAATLAVQPYADIEIDGRVFPLSNFFLTVGTTGERKTAVDDLALFPHKEIQDTRTDEYKREKKLFEKEMEIYKKAKDKALSQKNKERDAMREALAQLGDPPTPPRSPLILLDDPTIEGLLKHYHDLGCSSLGIFSGEGARFLGGYGMNPENMLRTAGGLSDLWGGKPLNRIRAGDGTIVVRGRRLSIHLMAQPNVSALLLDNLALEEQGLLPRFLFVWPESTCGTRMYEAFNAHNVPEFQQYRQRIKEILDAPLPFREDSESELRPRRIRLSADAKEAFIRFHDGVEEQIKEGEELHPIKGIACKAAEHAARLAAVIELTNNLDAESVRFDSMAQGIILMQHYLSEALRIKTSAISDAKILKAQALLDWLHKNGKKIITLAEAYQRGPNQIRDKKTAMDAFGILEDHNWIIPLPGGAEYDGMKRKVAWEVRS